MVNLYPLATYSTLIFDGGHPGVLREFPCDVTTGHVTEGNHPFSVMTGIVSMVSFTHF